MFSSLCSFLVRDQKIAKKFLKTLNTLNVAGVDVHLIVLDDVRQRDTRKGWEMPGLVAATSLVRISVSSEFIFGNLDNDDDNIKIFIY